MEKKQRKESDAAKADHEKKQHTLSEHADPYKNGLNEKQAIQYQRVPNTPISEQSANGAASSSSNKTGQSNFSLSTDSGFKSEITSSSSSSSFCDINTYKHQVSGTSEDSIPIIIDYNNNMSAENFNRSSDQLHIKPRPIKIENEKANSDPAKSIMSESLELGVAKFQPSGAVFKSTLGNNGNKSKALKVRSRSTSRSSSSSNGVDFSETSTNLEKLKKPSDTTAKTEKVSTSVSPTDSFSAASSLSSTCLSINADNEAFSSSQSSSPKNVKNSAETLSAQLQKDVKSLENSAILMLFAQNKMAPNNSAALTPISSELLSPLAKSGTVPKTNLIAPFISIVEPINIESNKLGNTKKINR